MKAWYHFGRWGNVMVALLIWPVVLLAVKGREVPVAYADAPATYEWTEDNGTLVFSDNPAAVPQESGKRVKKRETFKGEPSPAQPQKALSREREYTPQKEETYGGYDAGWWRRQFSVIRAEMDTINADLETKRQSLKTLHYRKVVSNSSQREGIFGSPRQNRENYREAADDIRQDEQKLKDLEQKLLELENEASRFGVPSEARR